MQPFCKAVQQYVLKVQLHIPYDPVIPLLGIWPIDTLIWTHPQG